MSTTDTERWQTAAKYLDLVLDVAPEDRERYLSLLRAFDPAIAAEVELLLDEHRALSDEQFLEAGPGIIPTGALSAGSKVGDYTLVEPIGYGGMGSVWLAERHDGRYEGRAAVKLLNTALIGQGGEERFMREGTILAKLSHPHIARLMDAGVSSSGQPFLVLEHVEGKAIDEYCDAAGLDIEARIRLFLDVLDAVEHAHTNLIVHRDLKPANVLVTPDGTVKLLDFGIAKLLEVDARSDVTMISGDGGAMTLKYAAPEQVTGGTLTTSADVYALGVLLYVLLAGRHPAGRHLTSTADLIRSILEVEPPLMSEVADEPRRRRLTGDLDTIVRMALRKRPEERYRSGLAFAEDLRRYLNHEPIAARADTLQYRAAKFVRRHRRAVSLAAAALVVIVAVVAFYTVRLSDERDRATREAAKASSVSELLAGLLTGADPYRTPSTGEVTVRSLLDSGAERIEQELANQPDALADMLTVMGRVYLRLGDHAQAQAMLDRAVGLSRDVHAADHENTAQVLNDLGVLHRERGDAVGARPLLEESLAMRRRLLGNQHPDVAITLVELARTLDDLGLGDESEAPIREALAIRRTVFGDQHRETATSKNELALFLFTRGRLDEAETLFRENLETNRALLGADHPNSAIAGANLALVLGAKGEYVAAEALTRDALAIQMEKFGPDSAAVASMLNSVASPVLAQGRVADAQALLERAVRIARTTLGDAHPRYATYALNLGRVYLTRLDVRRAEPLIRQALNIRETRLPAADWRIAQAKSLMGEVRLQQRRFAEAEPYLMAARDGLHEIPGPEGREAAANRDRIAALNAHPVVFRQPITIFK